MNYTEGSDGFEKDLTKALYWYEQAAKWGEPVVQFQCAAMYFNGEGTTPNRSIAKTYFQKVAEQTKNKDYQQKAQEVLREYY